MTENNLSQIVGALGGWLQARPYGAEQEALDRAARIVLDMRLLGVHLDDVDAPELDALEPEDRAVVEQARVWAQARREEARRRYLADERTARQRRVAAREAAPVEAFMAPPQPPADTDSGVDRGEAPSASPTHSDERPSAAEPALQDQDDPVVGFDQDDDAIFGVGEAGASHGTAATTILADPSDHEFFVGDGDEDSSPRRASALGMQPETVFKVVIVVWALAALGVLAVLLQLVFG